MNRIPLLLFVLFFVANSAHANPPIPTRKQDLKAQLAIETAQKEKLEQRAKQAQSGLKIARTQMIKVGKRVQKNERELLKLGDALENFEIERQEISARLKKERASIAELAMALQRLSRMPPQAMLARPGAPLKTAQTAMLLKDVIPVIEEKTEKLQNDLERINIIDIETRQKKNAAQITLAALQKEENKLNKLVKVREQQYRKTNRDLSVKEQQIQQISLKAKNLQDLVARLNAHDEEERTRNHGFSKPRKTISLPRSGKAQLPIAGRILISYDEKDAFGAPAKGLTIEGRSKALVVSPMGGVVRFTGHFKNYGTMIILEHENKYHSLIAGFEKVDTLVGQRVDAGEPLGKLHKRKNGKAPRLYYELRRDSKPINPATRLSGLS